jgi:hypothetical protein
MIYWKTTSEQRPLQDWHLQKRLVERSLWRGRRRACWHFGRAIERYRKHLGQLWEIYGLVLGDKKY